MARLRLLAWGLAGFLLSGCGESLTDSSQDAAQQARPAQAPPEATDAPAWIEISTNPKEIEAARKLAQQVEETEFERLLDNLGEIWYFGEDELTLIRSRQEDVLPKLIALAKQEGATPESIGAATALCRLREPAGLRHFCRVLESGNAKQRLEVLHRLNDDDAEFFLSEPRMAPLLLKQLDDGDPKIQAAAVQACGILELPGASAKFAKMLASPEAPDKDRLCFWLGRGARTAENLELVVKTLDATDDDEAHWIVSALSDFADSPDPKVSAGALAAIKQHLLGVERGEREADPYRRDEIVRVLVKHATREDLPWVKQQLKSTSSRYSKGEILRPMARLDKENAIAMMQEHLSGGDLKDHAAQAIGELYKGSGDQAVLRWLFCGACSYVASSTIAG